MELSRPATTVIAEVLRIHWRIRALFRDVEIGVGLSNLELAILASVVEAREPYTVSDLGRSLGHPRQVIQRAVNDLVQGELVILRDNPAHKRAKLVCSTATGRSKKSQADLLATAILDNVTRDDEKLAEAAITLRSLRHGIDGHLKRNAEA